MLAGMSTELLQLFLHLRSFIGMFSCSQRSIPGPWKGCGLGALAVESRCGQERLPRSTSPLAHCPRSGELGWLGSTGARTDLLPAPGWSSRMGLLLEQLRAVSDEGLAGCSDHPSGRQKLNAGFWSFGRV